MGLIRGTSYALMVELGLVVLIAGFCLGHALRMQAWESGYSTCKAEMQARAQLAYRQGREAGAEEVATGAYEAGRAQGWLDALAVWEQGGSEAMRVQLAVVKGER